MGMLRCPNCQARLRGPFVFYGRVSVRCRECQTKVVIANGFWHRVVVEWQTPEDRARGYSF